MSYSIDFAESLNDDLADLHATDAQEAALWLELIDLIYDNETVADELTVANGYRPQQPRFDTVPVGQLLREGFNVSRVKLYRADGSAHPHRLLYTLDHSRRPAAIVLLGLMPRDTNYESRNPIVDRMLRDYDRLGIPRVPRG